MMGAYDRFIARCKAVVSHPRPPEPPMRLRLHEAGHAVAGHRFGYVQQGIMLREDDTGQTSQGTPPARTMICPSGCRRR